MTSGNDGLGGEAELSRFAVEKGHYRASDQTVKPKAFEPTLFGVGNDAVLETSVFRTDGLNEASIWAVGDGEVGAKRNKNVIARAQILAQIIRDLGLDAAMAEPPQLHAVIIGWPTDEAEIETKMKELAAEATLIIR